MVCAMSGFVHRRRPWTPALTRPAFTLVTYVHLLPDDLPEGTCLDSLVASESAGDDVGEVDDEAPGEIRREVG